MRIVTIISDFGNEDHYAALLKGEILSNSNDVQIIDISHKVDTHDIRQAAYFLSASWRSFPEKTIHIVAVHNYYDIDFEIIVFEHKKHYFIGPNNGIFTLVFDSMLDKEIALIENDEANRNLFNTFAYGVELITRDLPINDMGRILTNIQTKIDIQPVITNSEIRATIIHIDKFENVILNVHREFFEYVRKGRDFEIYFKFTNPITSISGNYSDVPIGDVLCLFNSANYMEIAINMGKASTLLDLYKDETIQIHFV